MHPRNEADLSSVQDSSSENDEAPVTALLVPGQCADRSISAQTVKTDSLHLHPQGPGVQPVGVPREKQ